MTYTRKQKRNGKIYYSLAERVKTSKGWGSKTLVSYGINPPIFYEPKIIKGFAEAELKKLADNSVDLIIIDPPYGIEFDTNHRKDKPENIGKIDFDDERIFKIFPEIISECYRVLKNDAALYCFSRWDVAGQFIKMIEKYFKVKNNLIWVKNNWSMGDLEGAYGSKYENIIFAVKGKHILNHGRNSDILEFDRIGGKSLLISHQKPLELLDFLIKKSSKQGDVVLDCFMGSGSSLVSAKRLCRQGIGIEIDDKCIEIAKKRLEELNLNKKYEN